MLRLSKELDWDEAALNIIDIGAGKVFAILVVITNISIIDVGDGKGLSCYVSNYHNISVIDRMSIHRCIHLSMQLSMHLSMQLSICMSVGNGHALDITDIG